MPKAVEILLLLIKAAGHPVSGYFFFFPSFFILVPVLLRYFSLRGKERSGENARILNPLPADPESAEYFFHMALRAQDGSFSSVRSGLSLLVYPQSIVLESCYFNAEHNAPCARSNWRLQGFALCSHNWKLDLFQTLERWLLRADKFAVAFQSCKWHHLLYRMCKWRQLNNSWHSIWKPQPVSDRPVSDLGPAGVQRGN